MHTPNLFIFVISRCAVIYLLFCAVHVAGFWISAGGNSSNGSCCSSHFVAAAAAAIPISNTSSSTSSSATTTTSILAHPNTDEYDLNHDIHDGVASTIRKFLETNPPKSDKFYIQGWRWHTLSLIRDTDRLANYVRVVLGNPTTEKMDSTQRAVNHVVDFNLKGLYRIEDDVFLPWLRTKLLSSDHIESEEVKQAFQTVMDGVDHDRDRVKKMASSLVLETKVATKDEKVDDPTVQNVLTGVMEKSEMMHNILKSIKDRQDNFLVPGLMRVVTPREQKSFNTKVLRSLGIFESRKHLVGMHDAVYDSRYGNEEEKSLFLDQIPSVARMMIGRWRRTLYETDAGMLDDEL